MTDHAKAKAKPAESDGVIEETAPVEPPQKQGTKQPASHVAGLGDED
jgi:hypothetical protein